MDAAFYPMDVGTRNVFKIKMSRGKYFNLIYNWGWRIHAPRVQVLDNARKVINGRRLPDYQRMTFGKDPLASRQAQLAAIAKIGEMAPAKRMWRAFRDALGTDDPLSVLDHLESAEAAFDDWKDRTKLPAGVERDPNADLTLFYVNNTIYGEIHGGGIPVLNEWKTRPQRVTVTLLNGDHFVHGYANVDFGGNRGWENQFQSTLSERGAGPFFTFGRVHWWPVAGGPWGLIDIPPVADGVPGRHRVVMDFNFDPARRLRFYQFDPYYHDVAVFSIH